MRSRAFTHLAIATVAAAGAITLSLHLADDAASTDLVATSQVVASPVTQQAAPGLVAAPVRRTTGVRAALEQATAAPPPGPPAPGRTAPVSHPSTRAGPTRTWSTRRRAD